MLCSRGGVAGRCQRRRGRIDGSTKRLSGVDVHAKKRHRSKKKSQQPEKSKKSNPKAHILSRAAKLRNERASLAKEFAKHAYSLEEQLDDNEKSHLRQAIIGEDDAKPNLYTQMHSTTRRQRQEFIEEHGKHALNIAVNLMDQRQRAAVQREARGEVPPVSSSVSGPSFIEEHTDSIDYPSQRHVKQPVYNHSWRYHWNRSPFSTWPCTERCMETITEGEFWDNIEAFRRDTLEAEEQLQKNAHGRVPVELRAANALEYSRRVNNNREADLNERLTESVDFGPVSESADVQRDRDVKLSPRKEERLFAHHSALYFVNEWNRFFPSLLPQRFQTMGMLANFMIYESPVVCFSSPDAYVEGMKRLMRRGARMRMEDLWSATEDQELFPGRETFSVHTLWTLGLPNVGVRQTESWWEQPWFDEENLQSWGTFGELWEHDWWTRSLKSEDDERTFHYGYWKKQRYRPSDSEYDDYKKHLEQCIKQVCGEIPPDAKRQRREKGKYDQFKDNKFARPAEIQGETVYKYDACLRVSKSTSP